MEKKKKVDPNACRRCGKTDHWAKECPNRKQEKKAKAHLAQADEDDEATLLMATFCVLHDVEAKEKREVMMVKGHGKTLMAVNQGTNILVRVHVCLFNFLTDRWSG